MSTWTPSPVEGGTGAVTLSPPWERKQVQWLGQGYYVLRLATDETSRWLLGAGFRADRVLPHERTFRRSALDKTEMIARLKMNPWPSHLIGDLSEAVWRQSLSESTEKLKPVYDTGYATLWKVARLDARLSLRGPLVVLDGHHSRRAQINLGLRRLFGWLEPATTPQLRVRAIERAGWLGAWLEELFKAGELRPLNGPPEPGEWLTSRSQAFEIVQASRRVWCQVSRPRPGESAVDAIARLAKGRVFLKATPSFEEALGWLERSEVDTALRLPIPTKEDVVRRAQARDLFPQKATYFFPKVPFGILVEDLKKASLPRA